MEIVITSLPPEAMVAGKVLGLSLMALGQVVVWTGFAIGAGLLALASTGTVSLAIIPWSALVWSLVLGLPTFLIYAVISAGLGVIAGDDQQSQQLAGILSLIGLLPFWTLPAILSAPGGTLSTVLTLFPLTSATVVLFRLGFGTVPLWQPLAALSIALLCLAAITWLVTRVFRAAMLIYGQRLTLRQVWVALRNA
jgi:ABC-2 type transport system permease protein